MRLTLQEGKGSKVVTTESTDGAHEPWALLAFAQSTYLVRLVPRRKGQSLKYHPRPGGETDCRRLGGFLGIASRLGKTKELAFKLEDARPPFPPEDGGMWEFFEPKLRQR